MEQKAHKPLTLHDLLKNGINAVDDKGRTPVIVAMDNQLFDKADTIISMGANLYLSDSSGRSPIDMIRESGNTNLIISVIKRGVALHSVLPPSKITPEFLAEHPDLLSAIKDKSIDISVIPQETLQAIQASSANGLETVRNYIQNGGDVNWKDDNGNTLLMYASINPSPDALKYLVEQGADVNASNKDGATALMFTAKSNNTESLKFLLDNKANKNAQDKQGNTSFMYAAEKDNLEAIKVLDDYNADATITNNKGENMLFTITNNNSTKSCHYVLENLIDDGESQETTNKSIEENTKTEEIIVNETPKVEKTPQKKKININHQDNNGDTVLMHAVRNDNVEFVHLFSIHNADPEIVNHSGEDILMIAEKYHSHMAMKYIVENLVDYGDEIVSIQRTIIEEGNIGAFSTKTKPSTSHKPKKIKLNKHNAQSVLSYAVENQNNDVLERLRKSSLEIKIPSLEELQARNQQCYDQIQNDIMQRTEYLQQQILQGSKRDRY